MFLLLTNNERQVASLAGRFDVLLAHPFAAVDCNKNEIGLATTLGTWQPGNFIGALDQAGGE